MYKQLTAMELLDLFLTTKSFKFEIKIKINGFFKYKLTHLCLGVVKKFLLKPQKKGF